MKVRIYSRDNDGNPEELGAIVLKGGVLVQEPICNALTNLLSEPLVFYDKETRILIDPMDEPKQFLDALPLALRGSYVWAGEVEG